MLTSMLISALTCLALSWLDVVPHKPLQEVKVNATQAQTQPR